MPELCPAELKQLYRAGRVLPFIGAGASMAISWTVGEKTLCGPSWTEMVDEACRILGYEDPDLLRMRGNDLQILEYFEIEKGNFAQLTNWLVRRLDASDDSIKGSRIHQALSSLENCGVYYTTNYDDFLERAIVAGGRSVKTITSERDMGHSQDHVEVVKFHGDFNAPDQMVLSEGHYYRRLRMGNDLDLKLRSDLLGRAAIFVGYSFRDMNIAYMFEETNAAFASLPRSTSGKRAYIIVHNPSDFEYSLFNKRNIAIIPTYGDDRTLATANVLEDMMS